MRRRYGATLGNEMLPLSPLERMRLPLANDGVTKLPLTFPVMPVRLSCPAVTGSVKAPELRSTVP